VPLTICSSNIATRLLLGAICPEVFDVIVGAIVSTVIAKVAETSLVLPATSVAYITSQTNDLTISGTAEANTLVALFNGTISLGTVTADASGTFIKNINLSAGSHNITAKATDVAGNTSDVSATLAITVEV
jgi:hypothetical protein